MFRSIGRSVGLASVCVAAALAPCTASALAGPTVKFVLADGARISDVTNIVAKVTPDGDVVIEKVEFAVDDKLRATDSSTPYSFDLDTLEETEGSHTITATAFDAKGQTARVKLTISVDNELSLGADAHADTALAALKEGDNEKAQRYARRALKIEPTNFKAARALAGLYRANGELSRAVVILDKAAFPPREIEARKELVALHIARADEAGSTEEFLTESLAAIEIWKKVNEIRVADARAAATPGPEGAIAVGDALFASHDYAGALKEYQKAGNVDNAPIAALNRQLIAMSRSGKNREADQLLRQIKRAKKEDETTVILEGLVNLMSHRLEAARSKVVDAAEGGSLAAKLVLAQANLAIRKTPEGQSLVRRAFQIAEDALKSAPALAETQLTMAFAQTDSVDARRALVRALEIDPALPEAYALWAYNTMLGRDRKRFESADLVLDHALQLDPNNNYVLMAKAVSLLSQKRPQEAEPIIAQLLKQEPDAPDVRVANALNLSMLDRTLKITDELNYALKLDPERWNDVFVPKPEDLLTRVYRYRHPALLNPAILAAP